MSGGESTGRFFESELGLRIISAIVLLIIILTVVWLGGWPLAVVSVALSAILFFEWQSMVRQTPFDGAEAVLTGGFVLLLAGALFGFFLFAVIAYLLVGLALEFVSSGQEKQDVRWIGLGGLYCAIPAIAFPYIRDEGGMALLIFVFVLVWATDIVAYFVGRRLGGPKLWPLISPKKTWSGAIGGVVGAAIAAAIFVAISPILGVMAALVLAFILSIVSQLGDMFESWTKRRFEVKDSSQLIPGHGGFLDRVDGLVAATAPVAIALAL